MTTTAVAVHGRAPNRNAGVTKPPAARAVTPPRVAVSASVLRRQLHRARQVRRNIIAARSTSSSRSLVISRTSRQLRRLARPTIQKTQDSRDNHQEAEKALVEKGLAVGLQGEQDMRKLMILMLLLFYCSPQVPQRVGDPAASELTGGWKSEPVDGQFGQSVQSLCFARDGSVLIQHLTQAGTFARSGTYFVTGEHVTFQWETGSQSTATMRLGSDSLVMTSESGESIAYKADGSVCAKLSEAGSVRR
jgi:hypothetical protein